LGLPIFALLVLNLPYPSLFLPFSSFDRVEQGGFFVGDHVLFILVRSKLFRTLVLKADQFVFVSILRG
jgi:hypothetical protein